MVAEASKGGGGNIVDSPGSRRPSPSLGRRARSGVESLMALLKAADERSGEERGQESGSACRGPRAGAR